MENNQKFNFVLISFDQKSASLAPQLNAYALEDYHCDGIEEFSLEEARVDEILGERAYSGGDIPETLIDEVQLATTNQESFTYKYFFYQGDFEKNSSDFVYFLKENFPEISLFTDQKNFEDWNTEWKKFYTPILVSSNIEVIPEWLINTHQNKSLYQVYIYPGMGFGTGTHETTYLCLVLFDKILTEFSSTDTCLDFGCGSGILGITAMKTREMKSHFIDIDRSALDNCTQNLVLNFENKNISGTRLTLRERYVLEKYDLVFANILEFVLIQEKQVILDSLKVGGYLIVSGILNHQVNSIISEYKMLRKVSIVTKGDWSAILFKDDL